MSTIEKAAARLVAKAEPIAPSVDEPEVVAEGSADLDKTVIKADQSVKKSDREIVHRSPMQLTHTCELDFPWLAENGFLVPGHKNPQQAVEFRRIKRKLLLNQQPVVASKAELPTNVIFVTSSLSKEGKTFVSLNLALSLASEVDKQVLLVDGDVSKGDLSKWMGIHGETGLVDLLTGGQAYGESAIIDTNVERLSVMPCGRVVDNLDELYASDLMQTLLSGLASYDPDRIIVVDGPPLLETTEASVLARLMGQVVMIVEADKTPRASLEEAVAQLQGCQSVSLLLNKASGSGLGYGYGYQYSDREAG